MKLNQPHVSCPRLEFPEVDHTCACLCRLANAVPAAGRLAIATVQSFAQTRVFETQTGDQGNRRKSGAEKSRYPSQNQCLISCPTCWVSRRSAQNRSLTGDRVALPHPGWQCWRTRSDSRSWPLARGGGGGGWGTLRTPLCGLLRGVAGCLTALIASARLCRFTPRLTHASRGL